MSAFKDGLFAGRSVFVAGGTSGINLGIAQRFAALGAKVGVVGRNPEKAANAAASIGNGAIGLSADVRDYAAIRAAMEQVAAAHGAFDVVVSGAAGNFLAPALGMSANAFRTVVDIDLNGTFNVFRGSHDLLNKPGASLIAITAGQPLFCPSIFAASGPRLRGQGGHQPACPRAGDGVGAGRARQRHFARPDRKYRRHGPPRAGRRQPGRLL